MICKKCSTEISDTAHYCESCGAKVIEGRISLKMLKDDFMEESLGWDGKFFSTLRGMVTGPAGVISEYISGIRNKYIKPFTFFAIGAAIALFVFNIYSEDYLRIMRATSGQESGSLQLMAEEQMKRKADQRGEKFDWKAFQEKQAEENESLQRKALNNWNFASFLLLPVYALMACWSFGKPYNYAEHLVAGAYIQGITFIVSAAVFFLSIKTTPAVFIWSILLTVIIYLLIYRQLYQLTIAKLALAFLKFVGLSLAFFLISVIAGVFIGVVMNKMQAVS